MYTEKNAHPYTDQVGITTNKCHINAGILKHGKFGHFLSLSLRDNSSDVFLPESMIKIIQATSKQHKDISLVRNMARILRNRPFPGDRTMLICG